MNSHLSIHFAICFALLAMTGVSWAQADSMKLLEVTSVADTGPGTLRQALEEARGPHGPYGITFGDADGTFSTPRTIQLSSPLPAIVRDVTIDGRIEGLPWEAYGVTLSGGAEHRIIEVEPDGLLYLNGITLAYGRAVEGGAILNRGLLVVEGVKLINNQAQDHGGAIVNLGGEMHFINASALDNAAAIGGGIANIDGTLTLTHATLYRNRAANGAALFSRGTLSVADSILLGAQAVQCVHTGTLIESTRNRIKGAYGCDEAVLIVDPRLGQPGRYNGPAPATAFGVDNPSPNRAHLDPGTSKQ